MTRTRAAASGPRGRRGPGRPRGTALLAAVLTGAAVLIAACSGAPAGHSASQSSPGKPPAARALEFASCMRSHGVPNFPDPNSNGGFSGTSNQGGGGAVDPNSPQYQAAQRTCQKLLPGGGQQQGNQSDVALKFARCMRAHGVPKFPDPTGDAAGVQLPPGVDANSPQFQAAQRACQSIIAGLGGPGTSGSAGQ